MKSLLTLDLQALPGANRSAFLSYTPIMGAPF